jgi:AcrR family transcriptional regulator
MDKEPAPHTGSSKARTGRPSADLTRQKLLDAAAKIFSRDGFQGATTREIARAAEVNEVTLFRHFRTREELLKATLERGLGAECASLDSQPSWNQDLRAGISAYVRAYYTMLEDKEALSRALIAEARLLPESVREMILEMIKPLKKKLIVRLQAAQDAGLVRKDLNLACAVDMLRDALHSGMLARTAWGRNAYTMNDYLETIIETFVRGIETRKP